MRLLVFIFVASVLAHAAYDPELHSVSVKDQDRFPELFQGTHPLADAIGFVESYSRRRARESGGRSFTVGESTVGSGFFIAPSLFLAAANPANPELPDPARVRIFVGKLPPRKVRFLGEDGFRVKRVLQANVRYGFILYEIHGENPSYLNVGRIPPSKRHLLQNTAVFGYSQLGTRFYAKRCVIAKGSCSFCREKKKEWKLAMEAWGESRCLFKKGMAGAPLAVPYPEGQWTAIAMVGAIVNDPSDDGSTEWGRTLDVVSLIKLPVVQMRFGTDLSGRDL